MTASGIRDERLKGRACKCAACGEYFNSPGSFATHRVGPEDARRCLTKREMVAMGGNLDPGGRWTALRKNAKLPKESE